MSGRPLSDVDGVKTTFHYDHQTGRQSIKQEQDCEAILDHNKRLATSNDGYSPSREFRRVGSIPRNVLEGWLIEDGISYQTYSAMDRKSKREWLNKHLFDGDNRDLLTAPRGTKYVQQKPSGIIGLDAVVAAGRKTKAA